MGFMEIVLPLVVSFVIPAAAGRLLIPALRRLKAGQSIKEIGPTWHMTKQGTPTMGGVMFIIGIGITILALGWRHMMAGEFAHLYVYLFALVFGAIGFIDDYQKVKHHHNTGLTALQKFALQLAAAVAFLCLMRLEGLLTPNLYIPFWNTHLVLPWPVYLIFAAFVIVGTVNAVNITDGLDGLSSSVTLPGRATRPRSLRPRYTSMTCSARSLGSSRNSWASRASSASSWPRRRVPAMGDSCNLPRVQRTMTSGEAPQKQKSPRRMKNMYGEAL